MSLPDMQPAQAAPHHKRHWFVFVPLVIFFGLLCLGYWGLSRDAARLPSALIGKEVPPFTLAAVSGLQDRPGFSDADFKAGHVTVMNIFASWCVPCHQEHRFLIELADDRSLADKGVEVIGLAYKDEPENVRRFLGEADDPYKKVGADEGGRVAIDWGVYGVPETFVVRGDGTIAFKYVGPLTEEALQKILRPEINKAMTSPSRSSGSKS